MRFSEQIKRKNFYSIDLFWESIYVFISTTTLH